MQIEFTTRGLLSNLFRQRRKVMTIFLLFLLTAVSYIAVTKPIYEASGSVLIKFGHDTPSKIVRTEGEGAVISQDDRREIMQSNMDILQSRNLIDTIVREAGPERIYPGISERVGSGEFAQEAAVRRLLKSDLAIKSSQMSNVIDIQVQNQNPQMAAWLDYRLMELFIAKQTEIYNKPETSFLQEQVKQSQAKLEASQKALAKFKAEKGISSIDEEQSELLRQKTDAGTLSLESTDSAWDKISELQSQEAHLRSIYLADNPLVVRAHEKVELAQQQLRTRQNELHSRTSTAATQITSRINMLEKVRNHYNDLQRQVEVDEKNYKNYLISSEEARVNATLSQKNITSVVVVDQPTVPVKPAYPRTKVILAIAILGGLVFGLGTALLFESYDPRFTTPHHLLVTLGVPVFASFNEREEGKA